MLYVDGREDVCLKKAGPFEETEASCARADLGEQE